ncbi:maleylpyruvate isomerase N-terminal domain-containing protein [Ferruginibacter sp.]
MPDLKKEIPLQTLHLFPVLHHELIKLLRSLTAEEWERSTIAKLWTVKDIASHLLDGNLRVLSFLRDGYFGETPPVINSYEDLVQWLNHLNMSWTNATKRLSPQVITELMEITGREYIVQLEKLDPFEPAIFAVSWAGEKESKNWFHIAREYTEKFIHQQQIRDAVNKPALLTKELFYPFIATFMYGLPHTYRRTEATVGTVVQVNVATEIGGQWFIERTTSGWQLTVHPAATASSIVTLTPETAWKLFSKGISPAIALRDVVIEGDKKLGAIALQMVSVMA